MTSFLEEPLPALIGGGVIVVILVGFWIYSGVRGFAYGAAAALAVTLLLLLLESLVVTRYEEVEMTLQELARDGEKNDPQLLYRYISQTSPELKNQIKYWSDRVYLDRAAIGNNLKVDFYPDQSPPQAVASFKLFVRGGWKGDSAFSGGSLPLAMEVRLFKEGDRWKIASYDSRSVFNAGLGRGKKKRSRVIKSNTPAATY